MNREKEFDLEWLLKYTHFNSEDVPENSIYWNEYYNDTL